MPGDFTLRLTNYPRTMTRKEWYTTQSWLRKCAWITRRMLADPAHERAFTDSMIDMIIGGQSRLRYSSYARDGQSPTLKISSLITEAMNA